MLDLKFVEAVSAHLPFGFRMFFLLFLILIHFGIALNFQNIV